MKIDISSPPASNEDLITKLLAQIGFDPFDNPKYVPEITSAINGLGLKRFALYNGESIYIPGQIADTCSEPNFPITAIGVVRESINFLRALPHSEHRDYAIAYLRNALDCLF